MPRRPRWFEANLPLHLVHRANNRIACFRAVEDRQTYLRWVGEYARQYGCRLHAYVLMTNHVHFLLTPADARGPSALMQDLGRSYVRQFNRKYERSGTLWDGRFKAHPVQTERYLISVYRYIELNPVRAGVVSDPADYRWSSYHRNALGAEDWRIEDHEIYAALGNSSDTRQRAYRALFLEALDAEMIHSIRASISTGLPLGDDAFRVKTATSLGLSLEKPRGRPAQTVAPESRQELLNLA